MGQKLLQDNHQFENTTYKTYQNQPHDTHHNWKSLQVL